jgi:hypothetical protein
MNNPSKKSIKWLLAAIGSVGIYHASANAIEIKDPGQMTAVIRSLVAQGLIVPLEQENWYQINRERLETTLNQADKGEPRAKHVIEMLQALIGPDVNIRTVELFEAHISTQDYSPII